MMPPRSWRFSDSCCAVSSHPPGAFPYRDPPTWVRPAAAEHCRRRLADLRTESAAAFEALAAIALDAEVRHAFDSSNGGGVGGGRAEAEGGGLAAECEQPGTSSSAAAAVARRPPPQCPHRRLAVLRRPWRAAWVRETAMALHEGRPLPGRVRPVRKQLRLAAAAAEEGTEDGPAASTAAAAVAKDLREGDHPTLDEYSEEMFQAGHDGAHLLLELPLPPPPPPEAGVARRRLPRTVVWRLGMARLLRRCAEEAEWDAADRATKALRAAMEAAAGGGDGGAGGGEPSAPSSAACSPEESAAPPPSKRRRGSAAAVGRRRHSRGEPQVPGDAPPSAPEAASERDKLQYAAVVCVGNWAETTAALREARAAEGEAEAAMEAARAQAERMLASLEGP